ncbi:IucA/IucC family protein [Azomonas macrocytogenes]|uniref:Siderophore synthetase component n=1 Tax=Azomonas macrocytogenes TaxID=69962 RepID=A0A839T0J8_AZOMA|nr:IucA/IucC family siderophore biosynthesis protein [Azomonas macrocytogenes]MBB3103071.1 siderophore synthetase component [Azomonas macrocytogenes]
MNAAYFSPLTQTVEHLEPHIWRKVNRLLVRKALVEYAHEQIIRFEQTGSRPDGWLTYHLAADRQACHYSFSAMPMALRHWWIDPASIVRHQDGQPTELDALTFILDFKDTLAIPADKLPIYLDEISSTLFGAAYKHTREALSSAELADADFQVLEAAMIEGHPNFVANNGRIGFDSSDYHRYAPETSSRFEIVWIAVHCSNAHFAAIPGLDYRTLLEQELGKATLNHFDDCLRQRELTPDDYLFMPVHPWQWSNKISILFASDLANQLIVPLETSQDLYSAQQSLRTFYNRSSPHKCYVKTSLSILNMGFMRGLSPYYMAGTPAINAFLNELLSNDRTLVDEYRFSILQEVASIGYHNRYYEAAISQDNPIKKMLSALWRESPQSRLHGNERLMTMAALLHVDPQGQALLPELIRRSGLTANAWLKQYLHAFLEPVVHCFYAYDLVFMPHGENLILVLDGHVPVRVLMKDIAEETAILDEQAQLPEGIARLAVSVPEDFRILGIFIDIFDGVFRHMSQLLMEHDVLHENDFWQQVAENIAAYQAQHPELAEKFARDDFFAPTFQHSCLNRLQLKNNLQMVDLADPASSLILAEPLANPVAPFRPGNRA